MTNLGWYYEHGRGVAQDYAKAREWYEKAAAKGHAMGMGNLGALYSNGQGVAQDHAKAREWFEKAADKGDRDAMRNLGALYHNGEGVARDYAKAREWFEKAADKGDDEAKAHLEKLSISEAAGAGRYAEALQLQEALAARVEEVETKREGKAAKETAQALNNVAWRALVCTRIHESIDRCRSRARAPSERACDRRKPGARTHVPRTWTRL
jgi:TPR repeat protein